MTTRETVEPKSKWVSIKKNILVSHPQKIVECYWTTFETIRQITNHPRDTYSGLRFRFSLIRKSRLFKKELELK